MIINQIGHPTSFSHFFSCLRTNFSVLFLVCLFGQNEDFCGELSAKLRGVCQRISNCSRLSRNTVCSSASGATCCFRLQSQLDHTKKCSLSRSKNVLWEKVLQHANFVCQAKNFAIKVTMGLTVMQHSVRFSKQKSEPKYSKSLGNLKEN